MPCATPKTKQTWLRHQRLLTLTSPRHRVVLEEAEGDDDVPVIVNDADEEDEVDDLAWAYL